MNTYLVGGAVRDKLLGLKVKDRDWLVVGSSVEAMLKAGYIQVGKDFPVFLHPNSKEEYALARTERKTAAGYTGFTLFASPDVTLEEDLKRRDLTINALAEAADGTLIDLFNGEQDLHDGVLRHISPAFQEDPVRILRIARFAARFGQWNFHVAHGTNALMKKMVKNGEVNALVPERVWQELAKALSEPQPHRFFNVLQGCNALQPIFPELASLFPENDTAHGKPKSPSTALKTLEVIAQKTDNPILRWAAFLHHLPAEQHPTKRLRIPKDYSELAYLIAQYPPQDATLSPTQTAELLDNLDAYRRTPRFIEYLNLCQLLSNSSTSQYLEKAYAIAKTVQAQTFVKQGLKGKQIKEAMHTAHIQKINNIII
jgi:tRNA nucleotidyltransferase (CCA-adding enzyme)